MKLLIIISSIISEPLYCIVGGGFTGINIARKLKQKGHLVEIFEQEDSLGGKGSQFKNNQGKVELGPLFFTDKQVRVNKLINEFNLTTTKLFRDKVYLFDKQANLELLQPGVTPVIIQKFIRFLKIRETLNIDYLYLNLRPSLTISFSDWLRYNDIKEIEPILSKIITSQGYGLTKDVPAFYLLMFFDVGRIQLLLDPKQSFLVLNKGVDHLINKMSENLKFTTGARVNKINKFGNKLRLIMYKDGIKSHRICDKVIFAFPPVFDQINKLIGDLDRRYNLFKITRVHKYVTSVYEAKNIKNNFYLEKYVNEPEGKGDIIAIIKQGNLLSTYSWIKGSFQTRSTLPELRDIKIKSDHTMTKLNLNEPTSSLQTKNWDYFPHINKFQSDFFQNLHKLQGLNSVYFASTLQSFELVEHALGMAELFVETYF